MITDLTFVYDPDHFGWFSRHARHAAVKREIRRSRRSGKPIEVSCEQVALDLHKYYMVPKDKIKIVK